MNAQLNKMKTWKKYKKSYWYYNWDTYNVKKASRNRRIQWYLKNMIHPINEN